MTPEEYRDKRNELLQFIQDAHRDIYDMGCEVSKNFQFPTHVRKAQPSDIDIGNIIWYNDEHDKSWKIIEVVYKTNDPHRAYMAHDGCLYGLEGALVEI